MTPALLGALAGALTLLALAGAWRQRYQQRARHRLARAARVRRLALEARLRRN